VAITRASVNRKVTTPEGATAADTHKGCHKAYGPNSSIVGGGCRSLDQTQGVPLSVKWYTCVMPTTRPRYQVTETPELARALDRAAKRWPGETRSKLLLRLVKAGAGALERDQHAEECAHHAAVTASSGRYPDAFGPDYLTELREDWPA